MSTAIKVVEWPPLDESARSHEPRPTSSNVALVLSALDEHIRFEEFAGVIVCTGLKDLGHFPDGPWTDEHTTGLVQICERLKLYVSPGMVERAIALHAQQRRYNVLTDFLMQCSLEWDGKPRVDQALATYWGAPDDDASRAVSRVFLLSLAARGITPGRKVDTCPVFVGDQGLRKSMALETLVGESWFSDSPLPIGEKDGMQNLPGVWLWEFSEGESVSRKERNAVKAFLSTKKDTFRASYAQHKKAVPRQTCFAASTNDPEHLTDPTGARRFLPVVVGAVDVEGIERDRIQLLGEAAHRVGVLEEQHWETAAEKLAMAEIRDTSTEHDPWEERIAAWLESKKTPFRMGEIFESASDPGAKPAVRPGPIPMRVADQDKKVQARATAILRRLGYTRGKQLRSGPDKGHRLWGKRG